MRAIRRPSRPSPTPSAAVGLVLIGAVALSWALVTRAALAKPGDPCAEPDPSSINAEDFTDEVGLPNAITNPYLPLVPGTTFTFEGREEGDSVHSQVRATHDSKTILGVPATVVQDEVQLNGTLHERTLDWFAQDDLGNVWYFGEDAKFYDPRTGAVHDHEGSWEAGQAGAKPGLMMPARPRVEGLYRQEFAPAAASALATVLSLSEQVTVGAGSFDQVLVTEESNCFERDVEHKYYAPNVGPILAVRVLNGDERPELARVELVSISTEN